MTTADVLDYLQFFKVIMHTKYNTTPHRPSRAWELHRRLAARGAAAAQAAGAARRDLSHR
jgi:hypothetical protein